MTGNEPWTSAIRSDHNHYPIAYEYFLVAINYGMILTYDLFHTLVPILPIPIFSNSNLALPSLPMVRVSYD